MKKRTRTNGSYFKGKVIADARRNLEGWSKVVSQRKQQLRNDSIRKKIHKKPNYKFQKNPTDMTGFRKLPKAIAWLNIPLSAKALYPVLAYKSDFKKESQNQTSQEHLSTMSGVKSHLTVHKAVLELKDKELISYTKVIKKQVLQDSKVTKFVPRYYIYTVHGLWRSEGCGKGDWFPFFNCLITSGIWAKLSLRAKVLYLAFRAASDIDYTTEEMAEWEVDPASEEFGGVLRRQEHRIFKNGGIRSLCIDAGVDYSDIYSQDGAVWELQIYGLIEWDGENGWWKVYHIPIVLFDNANV